jgi:hypothetical protein
MDDALEKPAEADIRRAVGLQWALRAGNGSVGGSA